MKALLIGIGLIGLIGLIGIIAVIGLRLINRNTVTVDIAVTPTIAASDTVLTQEEQCRKNILSDNNLYEDRMAKAVRTCKDTQICTYTDFRTWSAANGAFVPDWRSEDYMNVMILQCIEKWPTNTPTMAVPTSTGSASPTAIQ